MSDKEYFSVNLSGEILQKFREICQSKNLSNKSDAIRYVIAIAYNHLFNEEPMIEQIYSKLEKKISNLDLKLSEDELRKIVDIHVKIHYNKNLLNSLLKKKMELENEILNLHSEIEYQRLLREIYEVLKLNREFYDSFKEDLIKAIIEKLEALIEKLEGIEAAKHIAIRTRSKTRKWV
ncbi:MAG: hypothetical protein QXO99_08435 [Candidatus Methanomethylicia archaeon]